MRHVIKFKEYRKWIGIVAVLLLIVVGVSCLTNTNKLENDVKSKVVNNEKTNGNSESKKSSYPKTKKGTFWKNGNTFTAYLT